MFSPDIPGQSTHGGRNSYTYGFEYRIVPLDSPGIKKQKNDRKLVRNDEYDDKLYVGMNICAYSGEDNRVHRGRITNFEFGEDGIEIKHIIIIDSKTNEEIKVLPNSVEVILPPRHPEKLRSSKEKWENIWACNEAEISLFDDDEDEDSELTWDDVSDDDMYRELVVDEYHIEHELEQYWTEKFYNKDLFKVNQFDIQNISVTFVLAEMWGYESPDSSKVAFSASIRSMIKLYHSMTGVEYQKRIDIGIHKDSITLSNTMLTVKSWKDIWTLCQCIKAIHRARRKQYDFVADCSASYMWNLDTRTQGYRDMMRNFLAYNLRMVPERVNLDDRLPTLIYSFSTLTEIIDKYTK